MRSSPRQPIHGGRTAPGAPPSCIAPGSSNPCVALLQEAMKQRGARARRQTARRALRHRESEQAGAATSANRATSNVALEVAAVEVVDAHRRHPQRSLAWI